ncbi:MAG: hypothetical protein C4B58_00625 [Deltaproteobacteria bacterium]|nr:MAG: hypothetical protein C4B58_00625 [Deltaproteobacteria bacterium]
MRKKRRTSLRPLAVMFWLLSFLALFLAPGQVVLADTDVGGTISSDTTWDISGSPYIVTSSVFINGSATLTIDPGVQVRFNPNTYLQVGHYNPGTLVAEGTEGNEILFTGDSEHPWYYINFSYLTGAGTNLSHAIIENGGGGGNALVRVSDSDVSIQNCTIQNSAGTGLRIDLNALPALADNNYVGNNSYPIYVHGALSVSAVDNTSTFSGNGDNRVYYLGGTISSDTSIADPGIPYRVDQSVYINNNATLTIEPGVELRFDPNTLLQVGNYSTGILIANGTEDNEILFTGDSEHPWYYINFSNLTGAGTSLSHAIIENGGGGVSSLVYVYDSDVTIQNCTIQNSAGSGLQLRSNALPALADNNYVGNNSYPIYVHGALSVSAVDDTSTFSGNGDNRVYYYGGTVGSDTSIADPGIPYRVDQSVYINNNATLTIEPGVELRFDPNTLLQVGNYSTGTLVAKGTDEDNIKFTSGSETPAPGDWYGVYFTSLTGDGSMLGHTIVEYAGLSNYGIYIDGPSPTIDSCTIRHSSTYGVRVNGSGAEPAINCNTITANDVGIYVSGNANPQINDNDIRGNTTYGVRNLNSSQVVDASDNYWGAADGPSGEGLGTGDAITVNVLYAPFATESVPCTVPLNADFAAGPTEGCEELTVNFTDGSTGAVTYWDWDFGDDSYSNEQNPVHTYTEPGTYTVTLIVYEEEENTGTEVKEDYITVTESVPTAEFSGGPLLAGTPPLTVDFTDLSTMCGNDTITAWAWDFDSNGEIDSTTPEPTIEFLAAGHYTVSLEVTDNDGDNDTETKEDYIFVSDENPVADPGGPYSEIEGQPINFDGSGSYDPNGGEITYAWDFNDDGVIDNTAENPWYTYPQDSEEQPGGVFTVRLTVYDEADLNGTNTVSANVTDIDPVADFSADTTSGPAPLDVNFTDLTDSYDGITGWVWNFGDSSGPITEQNPTHIYNVPGIYAVTLTVMEDDDDTDVEGKVEYIEVAGECEIDEDCDDGDLCTTDSCVDGECVFEPVDCDDGDPCTVDSCDPETGCQHEPMVCDDSNLCTIDSCVDGQCVFEPVDCDDGDPNTNDYCDPDTGECVHEPIGCEINEILGDLDGDCDVDFDDRSILFASMRTCVGDPGYNSDADYDSDGCVTFNDYRQWYKHWRAFLSGQPG